MTSSLVMVQVAVPPLAIVPEQPGSSDALSHSFCIEAPPTPVHVSPFRCPWVRDGKVGANRLQINWT
jgi:hypothetical protein